MYNIYCIYTCTRVPHFEKVRHSHHPNPRHHLAGWSQPGDLVGPIVRYVFGSHYVPLNINGYGSIPINTIFGDEHP